MKFSKKEFHISQKNCKFAVLKHSEVKNKQIFKLEMTEKKYLFL